MWNIYVYYPNLDSKKTHYQQNQEANDRLGENVHSSDHKQRANLLICKELLEFEDKKSNREWAKAMNRQFAERKKPQMALIHLNDAQPYTEEKCKLKLQCDIISHL